MSNLEEGFRGILGNVLHTYHENLHDFLSNQPQGSLTDADVTIMIMNLVIGVATNIYYNIKQILPDTKHDYDFIRAKIINELSDSFNRIKEYTPNNDTIPLTVDQVKEILHQGFTVLQKEDGTERKITEKELLIKKEDMEKVVSEVKNQVNNKKIILPPTEILKRRKK